jgi:hypothetical protein
MSIAPAYYHGQPDEARNNVVSFSMRGLPSEPDRRRRSTRHLLYRAGAGRPGTGTLQVRAASNDGGSAAVYAVGLIGGTHIFSTGPLDITSSATGRLDGNPVFRRRRPRGRSRHGKRGVPRDVLRRRRRYVQLRPSVQQPMQRRAANSWRLRHQVGRSDDDRGLVIPAARAVVNRPPSAKLAPTSGGVGRSWTSWRGGSRCAAAVPDESP